MIFHEFGPCDAPAILLLHGGGLSWWSWRRVMEQMQTDCRVILPEIDGYGNAADTMFVSIESVAHKVVEYIDESCRGTVLALGGLSLGAQIAVETLSIRPDIAKYAILESALVCPVPGTRLFTAPACAISYGLISKHWFSRLQARELCVPEEQFEEYYADSLKISRQSLVNTILSNGTYSLKTGIRQTTAQTLVIVGDREVKAERRSAKILCEAIPNSRFFLAEGMKHGEWSLRHPDEYAAQLKHFLNLKA